METVYFFKNMRQSEETELREYFVTKLPALQKLIAKYPSDGVMLQVKGERFKKHSAYQVELTLKLFGATYTAQEDSHLITKAVDLARDRLTMQLKKNLVQARRTHRSLKAKSKPMLRAASLQP